MPRRVEYVAKRSCSWRHDTKTLLVTTAITVGLVGAAAAQTAMAPGFVTAANAMDVHGSELIGASVYAADYAGDAQAYAESDGAEFEDIGAIDDILLTRDGEVRAVLVDVGGFLGIGSKTVAVEMAALNFVDDGDDWRVVIDGSREMLEDAPTFREVADAGGSNATEAGWIRAENSALTAENVEGVAVYDAKDENIGSIADLVLTGAGEIEAAVIDVGGFLGMGSHRVAVPFDDVRILRQADGDDFRAEVDLDEERLRAMPAHES